MSKQKSENKSGLKSNKYLTKEELKSKDRLMTEEEAQDFFEKVKKEKEKNKHIDPKEHLFEKWGSEAK